MKKYSRHIIFDLDGTLLDTEFEVSRITAELATENGCAITADEVFVKHAGFSSHEKFTRIAAECGMVFSAEKLDELHRLHETRKAALSDLPVLPVNPRIPELLKELAADDNNLLSLGSSNLTARSRICLQKTGLISYFEPRLYGPDRAQGLKKPDPAIFLVAMKENGSTASNTIVVEDSEAGIIAGRKTGAFVVAYLDPRFGTGEIAKAKAEAFKKAGADVVIRSFAEFTACLPKPPVAAVRCTRQNRLQYNII